MLSRYLVAVLALLALVFAPASAVSASASLRRGAHSRKLGNKDPTVAAAAADKDDGEDEGDDDDDDSSPPPSPVAGAAAPPAGGVVAAAAGTPPAAPVSAVVAKKAADPKKAELQTALYKAHDELKENLRQQVATHVELQEVDDDAATTAKIESSVAVVTQETQSPAMAKFLGNMWKEMRMYAKPFYKEHLEDKLEDLGEDSPELQSDFHNAQSALTTYEEDSKPAPEEEPKTLEPSE